MPFVNDIAGDLAWLTPAPIGYVEAGWSNIVANLLRDIGAAVATTPGTTIDVLGLAERDGELIFDAVVDGAGASDPTVVTGVEAAAAIARTRAAATCSRCGRPGRKRGDHSVWPSTRCDGHATGRVDVDTRDCFGGGLQIAARNA